MGVFFLRKPKQRTPVTVQPAQVIPELEPEPALVPLDLAPIVDETPDELPGVPDLYAIVGVEAQASDELIRYAYRKRAARLHERRWRPGQAVRQLAELNAAYEILGKPDRRADYDRRRARRAAYERSFNGSEVVDGVIQNGHALGGGQRRRRGRFRLVPGGGIVEVGVIIAVIALAGYAATSLVDARSLVDLSRVVELGESLGLNVKRRPSATPAPAAVPTPRSAPAAAPTAGLPAGATIIGPSTAAAKPAAAAQAASAPTPAAKPANRFEGSNAQVSNATPNRRSVISVAALILRDGKPAANAPVHAVVHYRTVDERWPQGTATQPTDASGSATITFNVGDATAGHPVTVDVLSSVEGEPVKLQTSFTPR